MLDPLRHEGKAFWTWSNFSAKLNMGEPDFNLVNLQWALETSKIVADPSSWIIEYI